MPFNFPLTALATVRTYSIFGPSAVHLVLSVERWLVAVCPHVIQITSDRKQNKRKSYVDAKWWTKKEFNRNRFAGKFRNKMNCSQLIDVCGKQNHLRIIITTTKTKQKTEPKISRTANSEWIIKSERMIFPVELGFLAIWCRFDATALTDNIPSAFVCVALLSSYAVRERTHRTHTYTIQY